MITPGSLIRVDPCVALADLFQVRSRHTPEADIVLSGGNPLQDHVHLELRGPLTTFDQDVYFGLHRLAMDSEQSAHAMGGTVELARLRRALTITDALDALAAAAVTCSWRALARASGHDSLGSSTQEQMRRSLNRLASARMTAFIGGIPVGGSQLIAWDTDPHLTLLLNPRATESLREPRRPDGRARHTALVNLQERDSLRRVGDEALIAHAWLSAWAWPREARESTISRSRLADHIWADDPPGSTRRRREKRLDALLEEIGSLPGWHLTGDDRLVRLRRDTWKSGAGRNAGTGSVVPECGDDAPECAPEARKCGIDAQRSD